MTNRTATRKRKQSRSYLPAKTLVLIGVAVIFALGLSLAHHTQTAAMQKIDRDMPSLKGDSAVEYLEKKSSYDSLANAFKSIAADDLRDNPEAMVKLTPNDGIAGGFFGSSVAISGNTAIIGATNLPEGSGGSIPGAAYIFVRNGASWSFQQKLTAPDSSPGNGNAFGDTVGISGDTVVVAAPYHDVPESYSGAAYVFVRTGTTWALQKRFTNADTPLVFNGDIGFSVAISGDTVLVTAFGFLQSSPHRDFVHVFVREGTTWTIQATLITGGDETFTSRVAISGNTVVIGNPNTAGTRQEAAYIYVRCGTTWTQQQRLIPSDGSANIDFGGSVAISGNTVIIGAETDQLGTNQTQTGSAYIYVSDGTTWTEQAKLTGAVHRLNFGRSVGILGNTAIIGAHNGTFQGGTLAGGAEVFVRSGTTWTRDTTITAPDGQPSDFFGYSVAISSDVIFVGATYDDFGSNNQTNEGSAWAIDRTTVAPPPSSPPCDDDIEVNITTDQPDLDLEDDVCDVDMAQSGNQCSLRAAIQTANAKDGPDEILFNIPGGGVQTISPASVLPPITEKVTIDGTTQPGYNTRPVVEVRGALSTPTGLEFAPGSDASSLLGVSILGFSERGILLVSNNNTIKKSHIGTDSTGLTSGQTQAVGVTVRGSGNKIGDTDSGNLLVFNEESEIRIEGAGATGNFVRKNVIGSNGNDEVETSAEAGVLITDGASGNTIGGNGEPDQNKIAAALAAIEINRGSNDNVVTGNVLAFSEVGVLVLNSSRNRIGGEIVSATNVEGNQIDTTKFGVLLDIEADVRRTLPKWAGQARIFDGERPTAVAGGAGSDNKVFGNVFVVSDPEFAEEDSIGVMVGTANDSKIGNGQGSFRNVVLDCSYVGLLVLKGAQRTKIEGNFVGLASATVIKPNKTGIRLAGSGTEVRNNIISGNTEEGVLINRIDSEDDIPTSNIIHNNWIGTDTAGTAQFPNRNGVIVDGRQNTLTNNVISGNTLVGLQIQDNQNTIENNRIGTNAVGDAANGNGDGGMLVLSSNNTISNNTVSANEGGIAIARDPERPTILANNNTLRGNTVGTNRAGTAGLGGQIAGIIIANGSQNNVIGGTSAGASNVISGNAQTGIFLQLGESQGAVPPTDNKIQGNFIGTNISGTAAIPNGQDGIVLSTATRTLIGGFGADMPAARNTISGNGRNGISLVNGANLNRISGNYIGTKGDGQTALGNTERGIRVGVSVSGTIIGGPEQNAGNTIAFNGSNGISLTNDAGNNNIIDPNRIFGNVLAGIDIGENGFTPNDPADADIGPNKLQNYPTMTLALVGGDLIVSYQVDSAPQHSTYGGSGIYVEFFEADATGAGQNFLGSDHYLLSDYTNGTPGIRQKNLGNAAALGIVAGDRLTATATDADGNSSEFTPAVNGPGASPVTVGGRVTTPTGLGLRNATVSMIDPLGVRRTATTSSFGLYSFTNVAAGVSYTITVSSKRYRFSPRVMVISDNLSNIDFVGLE
ncbi:MAG: right-handed parallel beta-helix repeat-containing protein [Acidobacteria bacterium]|nr:right-handed parallel beta-helix repeat-containing protein [Acidobacteriota bacterium]